MPRIRPPTFCISRYGAPAAVSTSFDHVTSSEFRALPNSSISDVEIQRPGGPRVELARRGDIGVDRKDVVPGVGSNRAVDARPSRQRLLGGIAEPGQDVAAVAQRPGDAEQVGPRLGSQRGERRDQDVGERRQERLAVLPWGCSPGQLQRLERRLAGCNGDAVVWHLERAGHLQDLVDRVGGDPDHTVERSVARFVLIEAQRIRGTCREIGRPVRVCELPGLRCSEQVVRELLRRLDPGVVPREVQLESRRGSCNRRLIRGRTR